MSVVASDWHAARTTAAEDWPLGRVLDAKGQERVAVVIPARNESATIADVVTRIRSDLGSSGLVDELVVMDSMSTDDTADRARRAGATVHPVAQVRPDLGAHPGKGEALWKSLFVVDADIVVFVDADLTEWGSHFVTALAGPLLEIEEIQLVRGFYDRVLDMGHGVSMEGGRVTELVARPWLALHRPDLSRVVQPLAGEWAIRHRTIEQLPVPVGYGVEMSTLLDVRDAHGLASVAQVDLGRRAHRHQNLHDLGAMAVEILATADRRRTPRAPTHVPAGAAVSLTTFSHDRTALERDVATWERPPAVLFRPPD